MTPFRTKHTLTYRFGKKQWGFGILRSPATFRITFLKWELAIFSNHRNTDLFCEGYIDGVADSKKGS